MAGWSPMVERVDHLGLRSAMTDRLLPILVGAMSFLAVLAIAGTLAAASLASEWKGDTGAALTVQVPDPSSPVALGVASGGTITRTQAVLAVLRAMPGVSAAKALSGPEIDALLRPWLGEDAAKLAMPVPAVITATWTGADSIDALRAALDEAAPGTLAETGARWAARVAALTASLMASAISILLIVALVASAVVAVATRAGLAQRRETITIIHGLGALDADIADRFAIRATILTVMGAAIGAGLAMPVVFWLAALATPFAGVLPHESAPSLPLELWLALPGVALAAAAIGWVTAQFTVRGWLRGLT
jgi:cell division transport system permease protein